MEQIRIFSKMFCKCLSVYAYTIYYMFLKFAIIFLRNFYGHIQCSLKKFPLNFNKKLVTT